MNDAGSQKIRRIGAHETFCRICRRRLVDHRPGCVFPTGPTATSAASCCASSAAVHATASDGPRNGRAAAEVHPPLQGRSALDTRSLHGKSSSGPRTLLLGSRLSANQSGQGRSLNSLTGVVDRN